MGRVSPFQLEVIIAIGMFIVSVPALFIVQKSLYVPIKSAPLALAVGLLFSIGSFVYVLALSRLPVSIAAPVSTGYVVLAVALSAIFLKEQISLVRGIGILLTVVGVAILSV
jgi:drug/metabolite transporter (DMT)-like permease